MSKSNKSIKMLKFTGDLSDEAIATIVTCVEGAVAMICMAEGVSPNDQMAHIKRALVYRELLSISAEAASVYYKMDDDEAKAMHNDLREVYNKHVLLQEEKFKKANDHA